jgi:hypothetical protein
VAFCRVKDGLLQRKRWHIGKRLVIRSRIIGGNRYVGSMTIGSQAKALFHLKSLEMTVKKVIFA